jgi:LysM repeat protein/ABC-type branched-subunit amino acid transport system substrate-binding protein
MKSGLLTILFSFFLFTGLFAQDVKISAVIEKVDGKDYYIHTVQKGESVWKIAKAYGVTSDDITTVNPGSEKKVKPGEKLKIPVIKSEVKQANETFDHLVEKGENLSSIAKKYAVTVDAINKVNPGLNEKIKPGQVIKIPLTAANKKNQVNKDSLGLKGDSAAYDCNKPKLLDSYNIALMIPFYLDNIYQINPDAPDIREKDASDYISLTFVQYYEGILMALDSLKKTGFSATIYVYDVDEDTASAIKVLQKPELSKMHLIIGPFFENSIKVVAAFARKNNIKVVDPVTLGNGVLKGNPNVFKVSPSAKMQLKQLASFIAGRYPASPVIIVYNNNENEKEYFNCFKTFLKDDLKKAGVADTGNYKVVVYNQSGIGGITKYFKNPDTNIVVTLSNGEIFVTNYVTKLNDISDKYNMIVFGLPGWQDFDNIETEYLQNINLHLFSASFVDYTDDNVKDFIQKYRDTYKSEPDKYAFQGYDVAMFFFAALKNYGINFDKCIDKISGTYLQDNYKFVKAGERDGFENTFLNIYRYEDYRLVDVRKHPKIKEKEKKKKKY